MDDTIPINMVIKHLTAQLVEAYARRNSLIVECHARGHSLRQLAKEFDLSHPMIHHIIATHKAAKELVDSMDTGTEE